MQLLLVNTFLKHHSIIIFYRTNRYHYYEKTTKNCQRMPLTAYWTHEFSRDFTGGLVNFFWGHIYKTVQPWKMH